MVTVGYLKPGPPNFESRKKRLGTVAPVPSPDFYAVVADSKPSNCIL